MRSMAAFAVALWMCCVVAAEGVAAEGAEKKPGPKEGAKAKAIGEFALKKAATEDDAATRKIKQALKDKKVSFDFVQTPFGDALSFIQALIDVNIVVAPEVDRKEPLTLKVNDMAVGAAIQWMLQLVDAKMEIKDGAIFVSRGKDSVKGADRRKLEAMARKYQGAKARAYQRMVGRAQIKLGHLASVELYLYEDELGPETREMLLKLLKKALKAELDDLEEEKEDKERHRE